MKLMVYSHDAFGLGNIRRMLAICQYLLKTLPNLSILVVSGSPALHSLRLPPGLDYIKLPCLGRDESGELSVKYLDTEVDVAVKLRSDLILSVTQNFKPDLFLVDKKPDGLQAELRETVDYLTSHQSSTKLVLLLRDILDHPNATIAQWQRNGYYGRLERCYDEIWVVGMPELFDVRHEYQFSPDIARKVRFCGYIRREPGLRSRSEMRQSLAVQSDEQLVLVTSGGGADGYQLVDTYLKGLEARRVASTVKSFIISGPEMPVKEREGLRERVATCPNVELIEFTDDLVSYLEAADVVVSMGGYNTVGELLSVKKRAIIVPRVKPVLEQLIRAERMAAMGLFQMLHPDDLTVERLMTLVNVELQAVGMPMPGIAQLDLEALPRIARRTLDLVYGDRLIPPSPRLVTASH